MPRQLRSITADNLADLPASCAACAFWELSPAVGDSGRHAETQRQDKRAWLSETLLEWGSCGQVAYVDGRCAGYILYAPAPYVPRADAFATSPPSADSLLLVTARVVPAYAGRGLGRILVQTAAREAARRGIRALEAFGRTGHDRTVPDEHVSAGCLLPADFLLAVGFTTVRTHPRTPRLRLDIRTTATWRADVESAIERLLGTIQSPALQR